MKSIFIILFIFLFSFLIGYFICRFEMQKVINEKELLIRNQAVELDSLRETIYMYNIYGKQVLQMIMFMAGLLIGAIIGVVIMCLLQVARDDEE